MQPRLSPKFLGVLAGVVALLVAAVIFYKPGLEPAKAPDKDKTTATLSANTTAATVLQSRPTGAPSHEQLDPAPSDGMGLGDLRGMIGEILTPQTEPATRAWANDLLGSDEEKRAEAVRELGFLDDRRWVAVIISVLSRDERANVRAAAAAALATQSSSPAAAHALSTAITDPDPEVREDALLSLKAIRNDTVEKDLRRLLAEGKLDAETTREIRLFLDRYYVHLDPLVDPLVE